MQRMIRMTALALVAAGVLVGPVAEASASSSPSVTATNPSHVTQTSAQFNGTVNPNGASTTYFFQYGLSTAYGFNTAVQKAGHGTKVIKVSAAAPGLIPGTVYHFRILAFNSRGGAVGIDHMFKTAGPPPPSPTTLPATGLTTTSATMNGTINPNGAVTGYVFQYGTTTTYGQAAPYPPQSVSAGSVPVQVSYTLPGLTPGTTYHYRLVAYHGTTAIAYGTDQPFLTEPSPRPKPQVQASITPHRIRHKPFVFTISGKVSGPSSIPSMYACSGEVAVRYYLGKKNVAFTLIPVAPDCSFAGQTGFAHKPGRGAKNRKVTLKVAVYFRGNGYLAPRFAKTQRVTLG